jgi:hypothetical protein
MDGPRAAAAEVTYTRPGDSGQVPAVQEYTEGFTYTDPASGESDTIKITLNNTGMEWVQGWMPQKGDVITASIILQNWDDPGDLQTYKCGKFCLDDLSFRGPVLTCEIGGVSVPEGNAFRCTARSKTWKDATAREVGAEIARRYSLEFDYTGETVKLGTVEQDSEPDSTFLERVCRDHGLAVKVYYGKLIIYDKGIFEAREETAVLKAQDLQDWSYNTTLAGTYTGAEVKYTSGEDDKEYSCKVGGGKRILTIKERVESLQEAQTLACARVNAENEKAETMQVTIRADFRVCAGCTVKVEGLGRLSGKYFVDSVTHNLAGNAYTMDLDMHRCVQRISAASELNINDGQEDSSEELSAGAKVIVNGPAYWGGNGGRYNQCKNMTMYITQVLDNNYKYRYGVARRRGGTRYGWCHEDSLERA